VSADQRRKAMAADGRKRPVFFLLTVEMLILILTSTFGLIGSYYRFQYIEKQQGMLENFLPKNPWPPLYMPQFGDLFNLLRNSNFYYTFAVLTCTMRYSIYYSMVSKHLYCFRLTLVRATGRLIPTAILLTTTMISFGLGGNQLFHAASVEWRTFTSSSATMLYLVRRPMAVDVQRLLQGAMLWPMELHDEEPSPVIVLFMLSFYVVAILVMANIYRAVLITAYTCVINEYAHKPPGDLTDDPWPPLRPLLAMRRMVEWAALRRLPDDIYPDDWLLARGLAWRRIRRARVSRNTETSLSLARLRQKRLEVVKRQDKENNNHAAQGILDLTLGAAALGTGALCSGSLQVMKTGTKFATKRSARAVAGASSGVASIGAQAIARTQQLAPAPERRPFAWA